MKDIEEKLTSSAAQIVSNDNDTVNNNMTTKKEIEDDDIDDEDDDDDVKVGGLFGYGLSYSEVEYKDLKLVELAFKDAVGPLSIIFTLQAADQFEPAFR